MRLDLTGQTALVTGASRGIGRAIAQGLLEAGAEVVLMSRDGERLERLAAAFGARGYAVRIAPCDVNDTAQVRQMISKLPKLEILVNNAGMNIPEPFLEVSESHFDQLLNLNLRAAFFVAVWFVGTETLLAITALAGYLTFVSFIALSYWGNRKLARASPLHASAPARRPDCARGRSP